MGTGQKPDSLFTVSSAKKAIFEDGFEFVAEAFLSNIHRDSNYTNKAFVSSFFNHISQQANNYSIAKKAGQLNPEYAGIPISVKDNFNLKGMVTTAGSKFLSNSTEAVTDSEVVKLLKKNGFVIAGRTNMTELAYSGVGINPHYGTAENLWDFDNARIPGGSSSGAAVSVASGMCVAGLGTDTGGSCRIPAALCGVVGFKPTASRVSMKGVLPLSTSLDSIGTLANSVSCIQIIDMVLADTSYENPNISLKGKKLLIPKNILLDDSDIHVSKAFEQAVSLLSDSGCEIDYKNVPEFEDLICLTSGGGIVAYEAWNFFKEIITGSEKLIDPLIYSRIKLGENISNEQYTELLENRNNIIKKIDKYYKLYDAVIGPTVPIIAPKIATLQDSNEFEVINKLLLRNTCLSNLMDGCSISIPCNKIGDTPVGLMLMHKKNADQNLLHLAKIIENAFNKIR